MAGSTFRETLYLECFTLGDLGEPSAPVKSIFALRFVFVVFAELLIIITSF